MTVKEIIDGLKFTVDMFLFDPTTGEIYKEPRNDMDKTTVDACKGAIELLEQTRWIPVSERLPENQDCYLVTTKWKGSYSGDVYIETNIAVYRERPKEWDRDDVIAWMPLPEPYKPQKKECADCKHYGKLSLDCGRCDDNCSMFAPRESEE